MKADFMSGHLHADELILNAFEALNGLACKDVQKASEILCGVHVQLTAAIGNGLPP